MANTHITIDKSKCLEITLQKTLYWFDGWTKKEDEFAWYVTFDEDFVSEFEQSLNDHILREKLDSKLGSIKEKIIRKALSDLADL